MENVKQSTQTIHDAPISMLIHPNGEFESLYVKSPQHFEAFTRVGNSIPATGAVEKIPTECGSYACAQCYLVPDEGQSEFTFPVHPVLLHPCVFECGIPFILLQILEQPSEGAGTWERSLAEALNTPIGQWLRVFANYQQERVEYELLEAPHTVIPEYPDFLGNVLATAVSAQILCLERRVKVLINEKNQRDPNSLCHDSGLPTTD